PPLFSCPSDTPRETPGLRGGPSAEHDNAPRAPSLSYLGRARGYFQVVEGSGWPGQSLVPRAQGPGGSRGMLRLAPATQGSYPPDQNDPGMTPAVSPRALDGRPSGSGNTEGLDPGGRGRSDGRAAKVVL